MRTVMIRYRVKPDRAAENEELVRAVYEELARARPDGLRYATFKADDGATFVHVAIEDGDGPSPLPQVAAFKKFQKGIRDRCEEAPVAVELGEVGSFRFFGG